MPWGIAASGRWDFYYTLTSVALLAIASGGVWLTFYIGRINIGQGAYALVGGYVSAVLVTTYGVSFWWTLPSPASSAPASASLIGLPILRLRGVYFAMVTLVLTEVARLTALALPITNGASGITSIPLPGAISIFGLTLVPDFATHANVKLSFYFVAVTLMIVAYAGALAAGELAHRPSLPLAAAERGARLLDRRQRHRAAAARLLDLLLPRRPRRGDVRGASRSRSTRRASPSPTRSTSC